MSAFTKAAAGDILIQPQMDRAVKSVIVRMNGPTSYDAGGSTIDLSQAVAGLGVDGFVNVYSVVLAGAEAAADDQYLARYIAAASYASATGKIKLRQVAGGAEIAAATALNAVVFRFLVIGT